MKDKLRDKVIKGQVAEVLKELREVLPDQTVTISTLLTSWTDYKRSEMLNLKTYSELSVDRNKIVASTLELITNMTDPNVSIKQTESTMMIQLKSLTQDSKLQRLQPELYKKALDMYKQYQEYDEKKNAPNSIYDSSGRIKDILDTAYKSLKESIENAGKDSKESIEELVNRKLSSGIPDWNTIQEIYDLAVGRKFVNEYIERNLRSRVNDDMAKVECADILINWAKNYLR